MKITVNSTPLELYNGAKVKDAILKYYSQQGKSVPKPNPIVEDSYGNKVAYNGELTDGNTLIIKVSQKKLSLLLKLVIALLTILLLIACSTKKT